MSSYTVSGLVATTPRHLVTQDGLPITSFRLASSSLNDGQVQLFNQPHERTNWFTITAFNQLAINIAGSVSKGERVIVTGQVLVRDWDNGERAGTSVEIEAFTLGHDLRWGTAEFNRTVTQLDSPLVAAPLIPGTVEVPNTAPTRLGVDYVL